MKPNKDVSSPTGATNVPSFYHTLDRLTMGGCKVVGTYEFMRAGDEIVKFSRIIFNFPTTLRMA
jgi:hypothetical protein